MVVRHELHCRCSQVDWTPQQELMDLRKDWWAAKTGFAKLPAVERIISVPLPDDTGMAQAVINNELDTTFTLPPQLMKTVIDKNPKVITHTQREKPYGYVDWWPQSLWINCAAAPYDDPEVRRALNHAINRPQIVEIGQDGAGKTTELPDIPIIQFYHRIAYNTTYWTDWPTRDNPYVNGAFWRQTFPLVLHKLQAVS
jgi:peptide/nickel transport system substrate-binding protein